MKFVPTEIPEVVVVEPEVYGDSRGFFMETWKETAFAESGIKAKFVQENLSRSVSGVLRGLHYQLVKPQGKLVRVVSGAVFDVAVDIRRGAPTFGQWVGRVLSSDNRLSLWVPPGFAHGFYVLTETADFLYKCTDFYAPEYERCILWDDPQLHIDWQIPSGENPAVSEKDMKGVSFKDAELFSFG